MVESGLGLEVSDNPCGQSPPLAQHFFGLSRNAPPKERKKESFFAKGERCVTSLVPRVAGKGVAV